MAKDPEDLLPNILVFSSRLPNMKFLNVPQQCKVEIRNIDMTTACAMDLGMEPADAGRYREIVFDWTVDYLDLDLVYPLGKWSMLAQRLKFLIGYLQDFLSAEGAFSIGVISHSDRPHYDDHAEDVMLRLWLEATVHAGYQPSASGAGISISDGLQLHYIKATDWDEHLDAPRQPRTEAPAK